MIKVYVQDDPTFGPLVEDIKGIRAGWQWIFDTVQSALCYTCDGYVTVDYTLTDFPPSLIRRIVLIQGA